MPRALQLAIAAIAVAVVLATAAAAPVRRIAIVNSTPALTHAAATALSPWQIEVVEVSHRGALDTAAATALATERGADRIAWLDRGELVVLDPSTGISDRRPAPDGAKDAAAAASVALSLKTVLRLPPAPLEPQDGSGSGSDPASGSGSDSGSDSGSGSGSDSGSGATDRPGAGRPVIIPEVDGGVRIPLDGSVGAHARFGVGVGLALPRWPRWRASVIAGFGPSASDVGRSNLQAATWSDLELGAQLALVLPVSPAWSIVPRLRLLGHRARVAGRLPPMDTLVEVAYGGEAGFDLAVWWRVGRLRTGVGVGVGAWFGLPDYERGNVVVFDSPALTAQGFGVLLLDL